MALRRFLDPKLDVVFKLLFSEPRNRALLRAFLTAVLSPPSPISTVEILNPSLDKSSPTERGAIMDLLLKLDSGRRVHVEMQARKRPGFLSRGLFYWARTYSGQLSAGQPYGNLAPTASIFILDYRELPTPRYHSVYQLLSTHDRSPLNDDLELHFLELPKLPREGTGSCAAEPVDPVVRWGRFLSAQTDEQVEQLAMTDPILREAKEALERLSDDPIAREEAIKRAYELGDYEYHFKRGMAEARELGLEQGRELGLEQGRMEALRSAIDHVCSAFGLPLDEARSKALSLASPGELTELLELLLKQRRWP